MWVLNNFSLFFSNKKEFDHPLANVDDEGLPASPTPPVNAVPSPKLTPATPENIATHLTSNDLDRIRIFVRE